MRNIWQGKSLGTEITQKDNPLVNSRADCIEEFNLKELRELEYHQERRVDGLYEYIQKLEDRISLLEHARNSEIKKKQIRRLLKIKRGATPSNTLVDIDSDPVVNYKQIPTNN